MDSTLSSVANGIENTADAIGNRVENAAHRAGNAVENAFDSAGNAIERGADHVEGAVDHTINKSTLKTLIDTSYDSVAGYEKAAEVANSAELSQILLAQAAKRTATVDRLNQELVRVGGELITKGTTLGTLHIMWMSITDMFRSGDKVAVNRVEEGEDYLAKKFEEALEHVDLDAQTRSVIQAAYSEIKDGEKLADRLEQRFA